VAPGRVNFFPPLFLRRARPRARAAGISYNMDMKLRLAALLLLLLSAPCAAGGVKVLLLGDSLTEGYGVAEEATYAAHLETRLKALGRTDVTLRNAGIGGSTSASGLSRLRWHLKETPPPSVLLLALGANDGLRGADTAEIKKNLRAVIRLARDNRMKVLLAGMRLPPNYGRDYAARFEAVYAELAREEKVPLIPFLLAGVAADPDLNLPDGIHPNEEGYPIVAGTVLRHLLPLLGPAPEKKQ
jgi:acyl-CoA thioesterase I